MMVNIENIPEMNGQLSPSGVIVGTLITQTGPKGKDGLGLIILGEYSTFEELKLNHAVGKIGDTYMVGTQLYVWNEETKEWINVGTIQGPPGKDGSTPIKGIDYFTEEEKKEIIKKYIHKCSMTISTNTSEVTLPCYYEVNAAVIDVYLNGERLILSSDESGTDGHYQEVGTSGEISNKIKSTTDWYFEAGDVLDLEVRGEYSET